jgi:trk system potassium uptake protein
LVGLLNYLAQIGSLLSLSLLLPALVGFGTDDFRTGYMLLIYATFGLFLSLTVLAATRGRERSLGRVSSIYLAISAWLLFPVLAAIPLAGVFGVSYIDGLFEAVSALTTTAADGITNSQDAPAAALFLRVTLQWAGALCTLLTFVLFLGPVRTGGMPRPRTSSGEAVGHTRSGIKRSAWQFTQYFLISTIVCFALLMLTGVEAYDSLILASTAISAGGYLPPGSDLIDVANPATLMIMAMFFLVASTSVFWQGLILKMRWADLKGHRESYFLIGAAGVLSIVIYGAIQQASGGAAQVSWFERVSEAIFNATSLVSTSGLQTRPGIFALLPPLLVVTVLIIGGGCYSSAGGVKLYRVGGMIFHAQTELSRLVYPHGIHRTHFGSELYSLGLMKSIWTMFTAAMMTILIGANVLAVSGMDFQASLMATVAAFSNAGPAYSVDWVGFGAAGWPAYFEMDAVQKLLLSGIMLFGHLEVIALIVALNPFYWLYDR